MNEVTITLSDRALTHIMRFYGEGRSASEATQMFLEECIRRKTFGRLPGVDADRVIQLRNEGKTFDEIAQEVGCSRQHASRLYKKKLKEIEENGTETAV